MTVTESTYTWLTWGVSKVPAGGLSSEVRARIEADREPAEALRLAASGIRLRSTWRRVTGFIVNGQRIYRIYLDDVLVGRAWRGGPPGGAR